MHIDRLHLRLAGRRRSTALARFDPAICHARLRELAVALDGQPWMVVSGLVEPLTNGGFTRAHSDIDIAIPRDNLEAAAVAALRAGFVLTTRVLRTHLNSEFDVEVHLRASPGPWLRRCRRLRLWRLTTDSELDESVVPSYVDVFPYVLTGRKIWLVDSGHLLDVRRPLVVQVSLPDGITIPVEDPYYIEALRLARHAGAVNGRRTVERHTPASAIGDEYSDAR
jgi:hypothetical protein